MPNVHSHTSERERRKKELINRNQFLWRFYEQIECRILDPMDFLNNRFSEPPKYMKWLIKTNFKIHNWGYNLGFKNYFSNIKIQPKYNNFTYFVFFTMQYTYSQNPTITSGMKV